MARIDGARYTQQGSIGCEIALGWCGPLWQPIYCLHAAHRVLRAESFSNLKQLHAFLQNQKKKANSNRG